MRKEYLGDSVYADFDGEHVVLTTENGYGPTNTIALDYHVVAALYHYVERINYHKEQPSDTATTSTAK